MLLRYSLIFLSFLFCTNSLHAQKTDTGNWFVYFGNQALNKKFNWWNEVQYRNYNFAGDLQQLLLRTGIGYNLTENNNNILLGYGFIHSQRYVNGTNDKVSSDEHRIYQQFLTRQNFGRFYLQHRYRIEERLLQVNSKQEWQFRFRYFLALNVALTHKTMLPKTIYFSAYNEIFVNAKSPYYDRNRIYGALGYVINKSIKAELGFMSQRTESANRNQFQVVVFNNLPIKSKTQSKDK